MKTYSLLVTSPDGTLYEGDVFMLTLRGTEGELAILAGHIPFITAIRPGQCKIETEEELRIFETDGGILTVNENKTVFFTGILKEITEL